MSKSIFKDFTSTEKDSIYSKQEIDSKIAEITSDRAITENLIGIDFIRELKTLKNENMGVKINAKEVIEKKFINQEKDPNDTEESWFSHIIDKKRNIRFKKGIDLSMYEVNPNPF
jgi:hypothetical protein